MYETINSFNRAITGFQCHADHAIQQGRLGGGGGLGVVYHHTRKKSVSSRRSVSEGAAQKTARDKEKRFPSPRFFYFFARCFLHCALTN